jgi:hypothetical protein
MSSELLVAFIGLMTATLGVFSAYLSKSKLVVHRYEGLGPGVPVQPGESHVAPRPPSPKKHEAAPAGTAAARAAKAPGIPLTVTGCVSAVVMSVGVVKMVRGTGTPAYLDALVLICFLAAGVVVAFAGLALISLRWYWLIVLGSVLAMFGLFFMSAVGLPVGIWCLVVLRRPEIRSAFRDARTPNQALQPTAGACRLSQVHSSLGPRRC